MSSVNTIIVKANNAEALAKIEAVEKAQEELTKAVAAGVKTSKEAAKEEKALAAEKKRLLKEIQQAEKQAEKERKQAEKQAADEARKLAAEKRQLRRQLAAEDKALAKKAVEDLERQAAAMQKLQSPAQQYLEKLKEWRAALQANAITQQQFNELRDAGLKKVNAAAQAEGKAARDAAALEEQRKKNIQARLTLEKIRAKEQAAIDAREAATQSENLKKNVQARLTFEQIRAKELAAVAAREAKAAAEQKQRNVDALIRLHQIRKAEQAAADARKKNADQERQAQRDAAQIIERNTSSQERYNKRFAELKKHLESGRITTRHFNAEVAALKKNLDGIDPSGLAGMGKMLLGVLGTAQLVGKAIQLIRSEFDNLIERQNEAKQAQLTLAEAERDAMLNLGPQQDGGAGIRKSVADIVSRTGASEKAVWQAIDAGAASAGPTVTTDQILEAVIASAELRPDNGMKMVETTKAILQQQKVTGGDAEDVAGFQLAIKQLSPAKDDLFGKNIVPAMTNMKAFGDSDREAAALLTTIGHATGDETGAMTGTAGITFGLQLKNAVPQGRSTRERMQMIRQSDKLRKHFLGTLDPEVQRQLKDTQMGKKGKLTGEAAAYMPLVNLLQEEDNETQQLYEKFLQEIPELEQGGGVFRANVDAANNTPIQKVATLDRRLSNEVERIRSTDTKGAVASISRDRFAELLRASGVSDIEQTMESYGFGLGPGATESQPLEYVANRLRSQAASYTTPGYIPGGPGNPAGTVVQPSPQSLEIGAKLNRAVDVLEQILRDQQQNQRDQKQQNQRNADRQVNAIEKNKPLPAPKVSPLDSHNRGSGSLGGR